MVAAEKLGWTQKEMHDYIGMLERRLKERAEQGNRTQRKINEFYAKEEKFAEFRSRRIIKVVD